MAWQIRSGLKRLFVQLIRDRNEVVCSFLDEIEAQRKSIDAQMADSCRFGFINSHDVWMWRQR